MFYVEFRCRITFSVKTNLSSFFKFTTWDSSCRIYNAKNRSRVLRCNIKHICNCSKLMKTFTEHRQSSQAHSQWKILNVAYKWKMKRNMKLPGNAPNAFIIPKTLPECFGAKSWGLTKQAELWIPAQKMQRVISNSAKVNDDLPTKPKN